MTKTKDVELIPKLRGRRSRDFKIIEAMQADGKVEVSRTTYKNLIVRRLGWFCSSNPADLQPQSYVCFAVDISLDKELAFKEQEMVDVMISPFWPCFWPSSFFFSHQVHVLLKVTLQENNKNII
jgi:hypothetical protein